MGIEIVAFDADDTLWHNETYFVITTERFLALLTPWCDEHETIEMLQARERRNLALFGYGVKGFVLSMIETAIQATDGTIPAGAIQQIVEWGRDMLSHPVELLPGVTETLSAVAEEHRLVLITKGDLLHQESKIAESGLADRFDAIEIVSEKSPGVYADILRRHHIPAERFVMVGNSLRSDVLPVVEIGGNGVHVPFETTSWLEQPDARRVERTEGWVTMRAIAELPGWLASQGP